jgi:hypothetical protein
MSDSRSPFAARRAPSVRAKEVEHGPGRLDMDGDTWVVTCKCEWEARHSNVNRAVELYNKHRGQK